MPRELTKKFGTRTYSPHYSRTTKSQLDLILPPAERPSTPLLEVLRFSAYGWRFNHFLGINIQSFVSQLDHMNDDIIEKEKAVGLEYHASSLRSQGHSVLSLRATSQAALMSAPGRFYISGSNTFVAAALSASSHLLTPDSSASMVVDDDLKANPAHDVRDSSDIEMEDADAVAAAAATAAVDEEEAGILLETLRDLDRHLEDKEIKEKLEMILNMEPMLGQALKSSVNY